MKLIVLTLIAGIIGLNAVNAQGVGINESGNAAHASAILDVESTNKGLLFPRLTTAQRNSIVAPAAGLTVYDTSEAKLYFFDGTLWQPISSANSLVGSNSINLDGVSITRAALIGDVTAAVNNNTTTISNNAVTSAKIADGTIVTADLADNSVNSAKIVNGSVATVDIANNAVTIAKLPAGASNNTYLDGSGTWEQFPFLSTQRITTGNIAVNTTSTVATLPSNQEFRIYVNTKNNCGFSCLDEFSLAGTFLNNTRSFSVVDLHFSNINDNSTNSFVQTNRQSITVTRGNLANCQNGDNGTALNYQLSINEDGQLRIRNNSNQARAYSLVIHRIF